MDRILGTLCGERHGHIGLGGGDAKGRVHTEDVDIEGGQC